MAGIETIAVIDVNGIEAHIVGHYHEGCADGTYYAYDIYVKSDLSNTLELVDLGQSFSECPSDQEVGAIVQELFHPNAVRLLAQA